MRLTGQLGKVMKESAQIAYTVAKHAICEVAPAKSDFFAENSVHLHVPEGAQPKDGPSAGITMLLSLLSLATGRPVRSGLALTGELSLAGRVLKVGGIKEKVVAAKRIGATLFVLPESNRADFEDLEPYLRDNLEVAFVQSWADLLQLPDILEPEKL